MNHIILLIEEQRKQLLKALKHLEYSYNKINCLHEKINLNDEENLEIWESFSARFSRVVDLFLAKFIRSYILYHDPGFKGSMRDSINMVEKLSLIDHADWWLGLRELRKIAAHGYNENDLAMFYTRIFKECPKLLALDVTLTHLKL